MRRRLGEIFVWLFVLCGFAGSAFAALAAAAPSISRLWASQGVCAAVLGAALPSRVGVGVVDWFTGGGSYMPRVDCLRTAAGEPDWFWIIALLVLNCMVVAGYLRIFVFWRRAFLAEAPQDRNHKLMELAWIFLWCAACGYLASVLMFFWPGYRLLAVMLVVLAFWTWKFAWNTGDFQTSLSARRYQRELMESLERRNAELEEAVAKRTVELEDARRLAERANRAKSVFLANMSHEIRTPLTAVLGFSHLLGEPGVDDARRAEYLSTVRRNGEHLLQVINDILDVSKIESGVLQIEHTPTRAQRVCEDVVSTLKPRADERGLELQLEIGEGVPDSFSCDPTRLKQILMNLVGNALKFTTEGSVRVRVYREGDRTLRFDVIDTGVGMTPEAANHVFQPFRQADDSTTRKFGGTGLGLTISRRLARALDGDLTVRSMPGKGSTFTLRLPVSQTEARGEAAEPGGGAALSGRILLVEDGPDNRRLIAIILQRAGATVVQATDGLDALEMVERDGPFDLVLMDMQMPRLDGLSATRKLRERGMTTPIVALTANALPEDVEAATRAGCDGYLRKPVRPRELVRVCAEFISTASRRGDASGEHDAASGAGPDTGPDAAGRGSEERD